MEQERKRQLSRQRQQLRDKRLSFAAQGRMLLLSQGYRQSNSWWKKKLWESLQASLPEWLVGRLAVWVRLMEALNEEIKVLEKALEEAAPKSLPLAMGRLTHEILDREVKNWGQFKNRRQIGSYSGLTGGVSSSGEESSRLT